MEKFEDFYYTSKDKCDHRFEDEKYRNAYYSNLETWNHQQAKIDKLEAEKKELVEALMRIAFEVPCCARKEARKVLTKIKSEVRDEN